MEVDYVLERLKEELSLEQWREQTVPLLKTQRLATEQAELLLRALLDHARLNQNGEATPSTFPALMALLDCLYKIPEVCTLLEEVATPQEGLARDISSSLSLEAYITSGLKEDLELFAQVDGSEASDASDTSRAASAPRLHLLAALSLLCPAFSLTHLRAVGLDSTNEAPFLALLETLEAKKQQTVDAAESASEGGRDLDEIMAASGVGSHTPSVDRIIASIHSNLVLQERLQELQGKMKRRDFAGFGEALRVLVGTMNYACDGKKKALEERARQVPEKDEALKAQMGRLLRCLEALEQLRKSMLEALHFFAERELYQGVRLADRLVPVHAQMMQVCESSVALVLVGLIKTGKSTIVDTLIGEHISPCRVEPMTAIPVRYIHDPEATEAVMLVPFFIQLNRVAARIREHVKREGREVLDRQLPAHLRELLGALVSGLKFKKVYKGDDEVLQASIWIHDLFRLACQEVFPLELAHDLPLDWSQGLDSFLTVSLRLPSAADLGGHLQLSIIDTPGVNEGGVKRLQLHKMIEDAMHMSHYVTFTVSPLQAGSKDQALLKAAFSYVVHHTTNPTQALVTGRDTIKEDADNLAKVRTNICEWLREGEREYPLENVHVVSGKRKLLGDKMLSFLATHKRKPLLDDSDPTAASLANEWALYAGFGFDEQDRKDYYEELPAEMLRKRCQKLVDSSNLVAPMARMMEVATTQAALLSCNKAIENALGASKLISGFLQRLVEAHQYHEEKAQTLSSDCEKVLAEIQTGIHRTRSFLVSSLLAFQERFKRELKEGLDSFLKARIGFPEVAEEQTFKLKDDADVMLTSILNDIQVAYYDALNRILEGEQQELNTLGEELRSKAEEAIFVPLRRVVPEQLDIGTESFTPTLPSGPEKALDPATLGFNTTLVSSQTKAASLKSRVSSYLHLKPKHTKEVFVINLSLIEEAAAASLGEYTTLFAQTASQSIKNHMSRILDEFFLQAMRLVAQAREAVTERERLRGEADAIKAMRDNLQHCEAALRNLINEIRR